MDADLIAALERQSLRMLISSKQDGDDYERIRAHIETLRNGSGSSSDSSSGEG